MPLKVRCARTLGLVAALSFATLVGPSAAGAVPQTTADPSDAPSGAQGETDLRSVTWDVSGSTAVLTVAVDESTYGGGSRAELGVHVLLDVDRDGLADAEAVAERDADGTSVDWVLRNLDRTQSTSDCQDLSGKALTTSTPVSTTIANGLERFSFSFDPTTVTGGLGWFRWAAYGQSPPDLTSAGPWDYLPDAANPDPLADNPGDRRCDSSKSGLALHMSAGIEADTVTPTTGASLRTVPSGAALGTSHAPVHFHWSGADNATAVNDLRYDLQLRDDAVGTWEPLVTGSTAVSATSMLTPGHSYQLRHRSIDTAGNHSAFAVSDPFVAGVVAEDNPALHYRGDWARVARDGAYGGQVTTTNTAGARVTATFQNRLGIGIVMPRRSTLGVANVCLRQGAASYSCTSIDLGAAPAGRRLLVFAQNGLDPALATTVRVTDTSGRIDLDGFELLS